MEYTKDDFINTTAPFEEVYQYHNDPFQEGRVLEQIAEQAKALKVIGFKKSYQDYKTSVRRRAVESGALTTNYTTFEDQTLELDTGDWIADDTGVWRSGPFGEAEYACTHPISISEQLRNIDTGERKVRLVFRRGKTDRKQWAEILTDFDTVSNAKNIVSLSRIGISVTSGRRSQALVDYLNEVIDRNYDAIPLKKSVSRMGWNEEGFSPYVDGVVFDGNDNFARVFKAIRQVGTYEAWLDEARRVRKDSLSAKIVLAASFASVLIGPLGCLPFFVHLWGMDSGTGKTVAQMVAASVWADPAPGGEYLKTFRSTSVAFELFAGFLNSLPMVVDELQLAKDNRGKLIFNVYELAAGQGKGRATKALGLASTPTWSNCFITSGETPLVGEQDGAGAANRVIEVECRADNKVIEDGHGTAEVVKQNYGHAGRKFIEIMSMSEAMDYARVRYSQLFKIFSATDTTEKQSMAASLLVLADEIATEEIFQDGAALTATDMAEFLKSRSAVSAADRGYAYMCDWAAQNANRLRPSETGDVFGDIGADGWVYIIRAVWNRACQEAGISAPALLSHLRTRGLIQTRGKALTKPRRINGMQVECVVMKMAVGDYGQTGLVEVNEKPPDKFRGTASAEVPH